MLGNILSTGEQVLILVVLLAVGFLCGKIRIFNDQSISHLSAFALKIVGPCAIVESFCRQCDSAMLRAMGIVALLAFAAHALYAAFAYVCIRGGKEPTRRVLRYGTVFANCGYMGLPLQQVLFGADGVFFDESVVRDFAKASEGKIVVVGPLYEGQSYGVGFPKGSKLVGPINAALRALKADGSYKELYVKWFGTEPASK